MPSELRLVQTAWGAASEPRMCVASAGGWLGSGGVRAAVHTGGDSDRGQGVFLKTTDSWCLRVSERMERGARHECDTGSTYARRQH